MMVVTYPEGRRAKAEESSKALANQSGEQNAGRKRTVGELQHLVDDAGLVLGDPHVLQDLDHHLWQSKFEQKCRDTWSFVSNILRFQMRTGRWSASPGCQHTFKINGTPLLNAGETE